MKRSEMIEYMLDTLQTCYKEESSNEQICEELLIVIEEYMVPPYNTRVIRDGYKVAFLEWEKE